MNCRFCGHALKIEFADLGFSPPSNSFLNKDELRESEKVYPLKTMVCDQCFLVQIDEHKKSDEIFNSEYVYFSSFSSSWLSHTKQYVDMITERLQLNETSQVVEVASNDGYLLQYFKQKNIPVLGIEPTANTAKAAQEKGIKTLVEFFGASLAEKLSATLQADLLLGNNVLAHVPDINDFVEGMRILLSPAGVITMEFPHLMQLIDKNQFDTIYHEHFSYLSLTTVEQIFKAHELVIFDVEEISTHGGSLRIYAKHIENKNLPISVNVQGLLDKENAFGIKDINTYKRFQAKAEKVRNDFVSFLKKAGSENKKVAGYGAAAKGNTLLNFAGVKKDSILFVADASPYKQGKFLPGSKIPVVNEQVLKDERPDYVIILPWNLKDEIAAQLDYIKDWGGKFIIAVPELQIF
ncbi:class I SAM-dependent methyltransferase [soil metagenome]